MASPEPFATISHSGTITTTGTFQTLIPANGARKGGIIQNTGAGALSVFLGPAASGVAGASITLAVNGILTLDLEVPGGVYQGEVAVTGTALGGVVAWEHTRS